MRKFKIIFFLFCLMFLSACSNKNDIEETHDHFKEQVWNTTIFDQLYTSQIKITNVTNQKFDFEINASYKTGVGMIDGTANILSKGSAEYTNDLNGKIIFELKDNKLIIKSENMSSYMGFNVFIDGEYWINEKPSSVVVDYKSISREWIYIEYTTDSNYTDVCIHNFIFDENKNVSWRFGYDKSDYSSYYEGTYDIEDDILTIHLTRETYIDNFNNDIKEIDVTYKFKARIEDYKLIIDSITQEKNIIQFYTSSNNLTFVAKTWYDFDSTGVEDFFYSIRKIKN